MLDSFRLFAFSKNPQAWRAFKLLVELFMIRVREAVTADLPRMMEIGRHAVTAAQWSLRHYEQAFSSGRLVLVIEEGGQVRGFLVANSQAGEWEIENIAVIGEARRRGLGSHLLGEFLHQIRSNGASEVFLEVRESNLPARSLYEKWAFIEAGRRKAYYQDPPEDAVILKFSFAIQSSTPAREKPKKTRAEGPES